jgi:hypothetical protein
MKTCWNETSKIFLTIAVLSSYDRLVDYLPAILETWVLTTTIEIEIIIFLEEKSFNKEEFIEKIFFKLNKNIPSCLFIVKLQHVENDYPPQKKSFYAMKFIYIYYHQRTSWVLRLDDNAYVNIQQLIPWLKSIDHQQALYIGQGGTGRRNGPPVHFPPGKVGQNDFIIFFLPRSKNSIGFPSESDGLLVSVRQLQLHELNCSCHMPSSQSRNSTETIGGL